MQLIPQSTGTAAYRRIYFTTVDSADVQSRVTGALAGGAYRISKNGAADAALSNSPVEVDTADMPGVRYIELTAGEVDTLGIVIVRIAATGIEPREITAQVVSATAFNPYATVQDANATQWAGSATFKTAGGVPSVNVSHWGGDNAVAAASVAGVPEVDVTHWKGSVPVSVDGDGYLPSRERYPSLGMQLLKVSQSDITLRKIYFYLHDVSGDPLTGVTWGSAGVNGTYWLYIITNGVSAAEATGSVSECDSTKFPGLYIYTTTQAELIDVGPLAIQPYVNAASPPVA